MKLNLVYGRSGTGKSEYLLKDIKAKLGTRKIYVIVPEQCNLSEERKLFDITQKNSLIDVEVLTLSRMAHRVENEVGNSKNHLSKVAKDMLIYDLLSKEKKNLNFLGKSEKNIDIVNRMFTEFKKHEVSIDDLNNCPIEDEYTKLKLKDITSLYEKYDARIHKEFLDENDNLTILADSLDEVNLYNDSLIYIDEFLGFTPQEYRVFEGLLKKAFEVTVAVPVDTLEGYSNKENDIFYFNKIYINKLIEIANNLNVKIEEKCLEDTYRFKNEELKFLEKNLYAVNKKYDKDVNNIKLFLAQNPYTEMENIAINIHKLVKNCGYHYNEIGIIAEDIDKYQEDAKAIFRKYNIPLFIDDKKDLNQNILVKFIIAMLEVFPKKWSYEAMFNYIKTGLLDVSNDDIYLLENYCMKWGIKGNKWYKKEFNYEPKNDKQDKLESLRKEIVNPLMEFKDKVLENKTAYQITSEIYNFLIENHIIKNLDEKIKNYNKIEISEEYNTSYKILMSILDDICLVFKDTKMNFEKYKELLQVGISSSELGKIPATQDQVTFGDTERTRSNKLKVLFVIGINDGTFPKVNKVEGFLNDNDRNLLKDAGIQIAKNSMDSLYEEQFNIYRTLSTPEELLFLSYSSSDKEGASIRPSVLIKKIKKLFPKLKEESDIIEKNYEITNDVATFENAMELYRSYLDGNDISSEWEDLLRYFKKKQTRKINNAISGIYYTNKAEDLNEKNLNKLYGKYLKTSVSRLESYRRCPFAFHLTYGLKLKEKDELKMEALDTGSFMHEVIDTFFKELDDRHLNVKEISDEEVFDIVNEIINMLLDTTRYYIFTSSNKYKLLSRRLKKVIYQSICYIVYSLRYSDFKVFGHETEFSDKGEFKNIKFDVDGNKIEITGKIDRIDTAKLNDKQYVRIIDYKSSARKLDMNQILSGLQIQLITYLDAVAEQTTFEPSGILYMGLIDNVVKDAKNLSKEEIEAKIRANFKMQGLILADVNVVKMMDNKLEKGSSDIIPVYLKQDGEISKNKSSVIDKKDFDELQVKVKEIIKDISREILKGKIDIKPFNYNKKTGCDYCKFKNICMFNTNIKGNEYKYI